MIGGDLLRYNKTQKYLIKDFETEGLNLIHSRPWQVSFAVFTLEQILEIKDYYIWWDDLNISADAARITQFDFQDYKKKALPPKEVLEDLEKYLYNKDIKPIFHNGIGYDCMIHQVFRKQLGLKYDYSFLERCIDTLALGRAYKKGFKPDLKNLQEWQFSMVNYREKGLKATLGQLLKDFQIEFDENTLHNAKSDILLNIQVFKKLIWALEI
jgi:hypothetical protein